MDTRAHRPSQDTETVLPSQSLIHWTFCQRHLDTPAVVELLARCGQQVTVTDAEEVAKGLLCLRKVNKESLKRRHVIGRCDQDPWQPAESFMAEFDDVVNHIYPKKKPEIWTEKATTALLKGVLVKKIPDVVAELKATWPDITEQNAKVRLKTTKYIKKWRNFHDEIAAPQHFHRRLLPIFEAQSYGVLFSDLRVYAAQGSHVKDFLEDHGCFKLSGQDLWTHHRVICKFA
jgi:hypothetical protein